MFTYLCSGCCCYMSSAPSGQRLKKSLIYFTYIVRVGTGGCTHQSISLMCSILAVVTVSVSHGKTAAPQISVLGGDTGGWRVIQGKQHLKL